ncbi:MAG: universal stress protein [Saprospiraceae bacterium]|nr:universal stress protein [Saprospiraceae bacterium]
MQEIFIDGHSSDVQSSVKILLEKEIIDAGIDVRLLESRDLNGDSLKSEADRPAVRIKQSTFTMEEDESISGFVQRCMRAIMQYYRSPELPRIIVPTDFSEASDRALAFAVELAKQINGMIKLTHVYFPMNSSVDGVVYIDSKAETAARERLVAKRVEMENKLLDYHSISPFIETVFLVGQASKEVERMIEDDLGDLIVMGSAGDDDVFKRLLGSVSVAVTIHASCPVFVIPPGVEFQPFRHVLYASEEPLLDQEVISAIKKLTGQDCAVDVVHLYEEENDFVDNDTEVIQEDKVKRVKEVLLFKQDLIESLHAYAEAENIDLIVMERKKRDFWQRLFHKSATRAMTIRTRWPLLILHEDDIIRLNN